MMRQLLAALLLVFVLTGPAAAATEGRPLHFRGDNVVHAHMTLDNAIARPGEPVTASIELTPDAGWHLYGPEHGDAGAPPDIDWKTAPGIHAGAIVYPPSLRVVSHGLTTYEYHGSTTLRVPLSVVSAAEPTPSEPIRAGVNWLVCSNVCVPGRTTLISALAIGVARPNGIAMFAPFIGLAFLGGLILNLMPCVFPVLSFKALRAINESYEQRVRSAIGYVAGVTTSCVVLGGTLIAARAGGAAIGWGFQLQSPVFIAFLTVLLIVLALAMSGFIEITLPIPARFAKRAAAAGAFGDGVLVTLIASACIAPYMGAALAFALSSSAPIALSVFIALGVGLALPQAVVMVTPALLRWVPKPGAWMIVVRRVLALPLYASAIWLGWVFAQEIFPAVQHSMPITAAYPTMFSNANLAALRRDGRPVLVDVGAAWCITCKVNERLALDRPEVTRRLKDLGVTVLQADWTNQNSVIAAYLRSFGAAGVPLYVYYPRNGAAHVWPQVLTPALILDRLR